LAFRSFDKDGSGFLTKDELRGIFGGGKIPDDVWNTIIGEVDNNGDGEVR
jgi:calcium-dependent protein kinase